jgi:hypothetical protein
MAFWQPRAGENAEKLKRGEKIDCVIGASHWHLGTDFLWGISHYTP